MTTHPFFPDDVASIVLDVLVSVTGVEEMRTTPELKIRDEGLLDSMGMVSLILSLSERLGVDIAPAEIEEEDVATPAAVVEFVRRKLSRKS